MSPVVPAGITIVLLTLFFDLLDMSFGRILWFIRTLRFWLYFILHIGISCLAGFLLHAKLPDWYLLGPAATILGVAVISNTNMKIAGFSLMPLADVFVSIKAKMTEQAAQDKATVLRKAELIQRLLKLGVKTLEDACTAVLIAGGKPADWVHSKLETAKADSERNDEYFKKLLIEMLLKANLEFVEANIKSWEGS